MTILETKDSYMFGGKELTLKTGILAKQADSSVLVQYGETVVLATLVTKDLDCDVASLGFFPLMIDYREKTYAAGKIPGGFFKREARPRDSEILTARLIDRPIRPLFPDTMTKEVMISLMVLATDKENCIDIPALIGASCAALLADLPFNGPIGAARIGYINNEYIVNPTKVQLEESILDLIVVGTENEITMIEGDADDLGEDIILEAIKIAQKEIQNVVKFQNDFFKKTGIVKTDIPKKEAEYSADEFYNEFGEELKSAIKTVKKLERKQKMDEVKEKVKEKLKNILAIDDEEKIDMLSKSLFEKLTEACFRNLVDVEETRPDGRAFDEIRDISCLTKVLPRVHGSAVFTRGETQALATVTLGSVRDKQIIDDLSGEYKKRFMLHYNFPSFSVGELRPNRGPGRREIGHGYLAEKALKPILPTEEDFPYVIRIVSEILESNGSSSQASVCSGTLALMDAGVPIKKPVAGISVGLVKEKKENLIVDIAGFEDHYGDMDFKVAGTEDGITAIQLDIKLDGINIGIVENALKLAKTSRLKILDKIKEAIASPNKLSEHAPKIVKISVNPEKLGNLIGPSGKNIKKIIEETQTDIDIQDTGVVTISAKNSESLETASKLIKDHTADAEPGKLYHGTVKRIMDFGAFVEILPKKEGLVHISQLKEERVNNVEDVVSVGDKIWVKVVEIDKMGRLNLSKKLADKEKENDK